jgi:putative ABC transport system ATP-binding protein
MNDYVIEIKSLTKSYGEGETIVQALREVDFAVRRSEFVAIMGPSGSGKSTLLNILGCLDRPTSGTYLLDGEDVSRLENDRLASVRNRKIGFVFQSFNLLPRLSALENVMVPMLYNGYQHLPVHVRRNHAVELLETVGLGKRLDHVPAKLSGGQQQRVAIARALVNDPAIILADEPTGNLDSHSSEEVMALIHQLHNAGVSIVMVTHDPLRADHAQRVVTMFDGVVVDDRAPARSGEGGRNRNAG